MRGQFIENYPTFLIDEIQFVLYDRMLLEIILLPLLMKFNLIYKTCTFQILQTVGPWSKQIGLSFWTSAKGSDVWLTFSLGLASRPGRLFIYIYIYTYSCQNSKRVPLEERHAPEISGFCRSETPIKTDTSSFIKKERERVGGRTVGRVQPWVLAFSLSHFDTEAVDGGIMAGGCHVLKSY